MKLFLDDIRNPSECAHYMYKRIGNLNPIYLEGDWYIVRTHEQFVSAINDHARTITHISFDHDLADLHYDESMYESEEAYNKHLESVGEKTGFDSAKYMKWFYDENKLKYPIMFVHSMNPVGTQKIINLFEIKH